jgi:hypothetical protein
MSGSKKYSISLPEDLAARVATTAMTMLEANYERIHPARIRWVLSRTDVHDVTKSATDQRRRCCAATASAATSTPSTPSLRPLRARRRDRLPSYTSAPEDISLLCGSAAEVIKA